MAFGKRFRDWMNVEEEEESGDEYLEIEAVKGKPAFMVRSFVLQEFDDIRAVIKALRTGRYIVLVDLKPIRENDVVDLRRAVNKLKAITAEIAGEIAGLTGDWIVVTPHPVKIERNRSEPPVEREEEEI